MYYNMKSYKENQCVIISGESGAGKTEAAKRIMQYIASVSGQSSSSIQKIKDMVLATNPLLESFGCAKTLRNNNSSRHGKYLEIQFNQQAEPTGANITNYLLEKARVVGQIHNERNFHIFYQLTKAAPENYRTTFGIQPPESYIYTSASKCTSVQGIDDAADFRDTIKAMEVIGLHQTEQDQIFRLLSAILWIGNIDFVENAEGNASIADLSVPNFVAYLLDVDADAIEKALTLRIVETSRGGRRGSVYEVPLNPVQAKAVRDALAKAIYNNLFDWIVDRVNQSLHTKGEHDKTVGILDIYGFEIFENNSFEQICINYVNEKLQQIFIQLTLKTEQEEYVREQIKWTPIDYFNNKIVCDLIEEKRPPGIFAALNDACATAHADSYAADQSFSQRLGLVAGNPHFEQRQSKFLIRHYAGDVYYDISGMTDKNKDQLLKDLLLLISKSSNSFLTSLFPDQVDKDSRRRPPTASDKIKTSANDLMHTLSLAQPSYIRTIKPNSNKSPTEYEEKAVLHQIKYLGLHENVRIRRAGFAYRQTFEKFVERFYLLSAKTSYAGDFIWKGDSKTATIQILKDTSIPTSEYQMGTTKVFIKTPETLFALEHMRDMYWHNMASRIQRAWRRYLKHKADSATKIQRAWRNIKGGKEFVELRDQGHRILNGRKERRRMSILGYRKFLGDYLACNDSQGSGGYMMRAIGLNEKVLFSCRGEILHAKFGRSSVRVPRVFILTATKFLIVLEQVLNRQLTYSIERTVPVSTIKYAALSNLRDDWVALGVGSNTEPDPFFSCVFKTELVTRLSNLRRGLEVRIGPTIEYAKKPGKLSAVKFQKDSTVSRDDLYKSAVVHVPAGEPANSLSLPIPPKKSGGSSTRKPTSRAVPAQRPKSARKPPPAVPSAARPQAPERVQAPFAQPQNPYIQTNNMASAAAAAAYPVSPRPQAQAQPQPVAVPHSRPTAQARAPAPTPAAAQPQSPARGRTAPPPPPPPDAALSPPPPPAEPTYKAIFDFAANGPNELSISKGEVILVVKKENNGWWLAKRRDGSAEGWTPASYVEEIIQAKVHSKPPPPPGPPTRPKPTGLGSNGHSPAPSQSSTPNPNLASGLAEALKQKNQANSSLAGGLAQALKARSGRRDSNDDEPDDDW